MIRTSSVASSMLAYWSGLALFTLLAIPHVACAEDQPSPQQLEFVRTKVLPLLEARCFECHKDRAKPNGGLLLSSRKSALKGGDSGPALVPGKPDESLLIEAVRYESFEMPPRSRMPEAEVKILEKWITEGAFWPPELEAATPVHDEAFPLEERRKSHWAWQTIKTPIVPAAENATWPKDPVDSFIIARLESAGLSPAPDADRYAIIRRMYFDIVGLPPTAEQVNEFVNDPNTDDVAIAKVADQLLSSPHFGERWGRHWLDLMRYAETLGHEFDYPLHHAHQYRDYVIRAFNEDVPYDQLVREHIAGDLIEDPRRHPTELYNESIIGTGFWFLNEDKHAPVDVKGEEAAKIDNRIDVFSKTFLGMTVACARCHDHKFDAISTKDYYALSGFLQSSRRQHAYLDPGRRIQKQLKTVREHRNAVQALLDSHVLSEEDLKKYVSIAILSAHANEDSATQALAKKHGLEVDQLKLWIEALKQPENQALVHPLSLPAKIASLKQAPPDGVNKEIAAWANRNANGTKDEATTEFADFTDGLPSGWFALGHVFDDVDTSSGDGLAMHGTPTYTTGSLSSARLSTKLRGSITSTTFELQHPEILVRVAGENCRMRLVVDGYVMYEHNGLLFGGFQQKIDTKGEYQWLRFGGDVHRYQGHRVHIEILDEGDGWFDVKELRFANRRGANPKADAASQLNQTLAQQLLDENALSVSQAISAWAKIYASDRAALTSIRFKQELYPESVAEKLKDPVVSWISSANAVPAPLTVLAMTEGTPEDEFVFIRGNHLNLGERAPRTILTALRRPGEAPSYSNSGRLELAEQLLSDGNPLTTRVIVNRIWHHLFGQGIVPSTDNFGVLGQKPTHPLLLDHLASRFRRDGWSIKKMIRTLVLSRVYRMSSKAETAAMDHDPTNALLHSFRVRRLQGEAIRDALLTISGRLDRQLYGAPVPVHLTPFMSGRGRPRGGPLDGNGRRSIYISVRRNFLSPLMLAFDVPAPVSATGKRTSSNVPAQALLMLNNEFVNQQAGLWADRLLKEATDSATDVLKKAWLDLYSRPATNDEIQMLRDYLELPADANAGALKQDRLTEVCHILMNAKEFTFLH